jgi:hypothetical protein
MRIVITFKNLIDQLKNLLQMHVYITKLNISKMKGLLIQSNEKV